MLRAICDMFVFSPFPIFLSFGHLSLCKLMNGHDYKTDLISLLVHISILEQIAIGKVCVSVNE